MRIKETSKIVKPTKESHPIDGHAYVIEFECIRGLSDHTGIIQLCKTIAFAARATGLPPIYMSMGQNRYNIEHEQDHVRLLAHIDMANVKFELLVEESTLLPDNDQRSVGEQSELDLERSHDGGNVTDLKKH